MWDFVVKYKWWILAIIVLIIIIIVIKRRGGVQQIVSGKSPTNTIVANNSGSSVNTSTSKCSTNATFPLGSGSVGKEVGALQNYINEVYKQNNMNKSISVDCDFGPQTATAVQSVLNKPTVTKNEYNDYNVNAFM
jgi:hypothetical protein